MARSHMSVVKSATSLPEASTPALFMRMSTTPKASMAASNIASTACSSLMSAWTTSARRPVASTARRVVSAPS